MKNKNIPELSLGEEITNSITHGIGAILAILGLILLLFKSDTGLKITASLIYGLSIFILMLMSCLYHAFKNNTGVKRLWRRFDYMSIYLLIAGTFAPILLIFAPSLISTIVFIIQWIVVIVGIVLISIFGIESNQKLHLTLYFIIGWSGIMYLPYFYIHSLPLLFYILIGGIVYTIGMFPFTSKKKYSHSIWHIFVLIGAIIHYIGIYLYIY